MKKKEISNYVPNPRLIEIIKKNSQGKSLDIGCGTGAHFPYFKGPKIYAGDVVKEYLQIVRKKRLRNRKIIVKKADIRKLPFENNFFDFIVCASVLECLNSKNEIKIAVEELKRVLKKGGKIVVLVPRGNSYTDFVRKYFLSKILEKNTDQPYFTMGITQTEEELRKLGFQEIHGCLNWVTWSLFKNNSIPKFIDSFFWYFPIFSGALIGIYEKK